MTEKSKLYGYQPDTLFLQFFQLSVMCWSETLGFIVCPHSCSGATSCLFVFYSEMFSFTSWRGPSERTNISVLHYDNHNAVVFRVLFKYFVHLARSKFHWVCFRLVLYWVMQVVKPCTVNRVNDLLKFRTLISQLPGAVLRQWRIIAENCNASID